METNFGDKWMRLCKEKKKKNLKENWKTLNKKLGCCENARKSEKWSRKSVTGLRKRHMMRLNGREFTLKVNLSQRR